MAGSSSPHLHAPAGRCQAPQSTAVTQVNFGFPALLGHPAFALGMALLPHLEGLFQVVSAWYDGSTSTAMVKEI
jgi:hypothetical protein